MVAILFCMNPLDDKQVDFGYEDELQAIQQHYISYNLVDLEAVIRGNLDEALRRIPHQSDMTSTIYRGWMLKPHQYAQLYDALITKNIQLINTPNMYRYCHHLPASYEAIKDYTPNSVWLPYDNDFSMAKVHQLIANFGDSPIVLKDYVKSQKHYWHEAFFIPDASDAENVEKIVTRFLELQGDDLNDGLVFREFVEFNPLEDHDVSGMPLTEEYRIFIKDGKPIFHTKYWSQGDYAQADIETEISQFNDVISNIKSNFFTMDIAKTIHGDWQIVELGDAQVAGLADHVNRQQFYDALLK